MKRSERIRPGSRPSSAEEREHGFSLVEALVALATIATLLVAGTQLFAGLLQAESSVSGEVGLYPEAQRVLSNLAEAVAHARFLQMPNGRCRTTADLVLSAHVDDDGDGRIDEDPPAMLWGAASGLPGIDDDCDGFVDEGLLGDDDEDGTENEDPRDGVDNDGDGSIDEDPSADANGDGFPGAAYWDDDGDGKVDDGTPEDDDEDGLVDEDGPEARHFFFQKTTRQLLETRPGSAPFVILERVEDFQVRYLVGAAGEPLVELRLVVRAAAALEDFTLTTRVHPANLQARHGITTLP